MDAWVWILLIVVAVIVLWVVSSISLHAAACCGR